jgi:hypothetical protein
MISIAGGVLALIALDALVSNSGSANFGGALNFVASAVRWLVDPGVAGVPNLSNDSGSPHTAAAAAYSSAGPSQGVLVAQNAPPPPAQASLLAVPPAGAQPAVPQQPVSQPVLV